MSSSSKKILKWISDLLVILVVVLAFLLHGLKLFGLTPYSVLSGSMEPAYPAGSLIYVKNTGAAFSILENSKLFLIIFSIVALGMILYYSIKNSEKFSTISAFWAAMLVAGISCNLYERIMFGYVRDFFKLNFIDFPVFNISDVFINIGVLAIIIIIIKNKYIKNNLS